MSIIKAYTNLGLLNPTWRPALLLMGVAMLDWCSGMSKERKRSPVFVWMRTGPSEIGVSVIKCF